MQPVYVSKSLAAASSSGIGTISSATPAVTTINTATLDTGRRVILWSSGGADISSVLFTITGKGTDDTNLVEAMFGSTGTNTKATTQDFLSITSIVPSAAPGQLVTFGTNTQGGTPWKPVNNIPVPTLLGFEVIFSSTLNGVAASLEYSFEELSSPSSFATIASTASIPANSDCPLGWVSTACSTATGNTNGFINFPIGAWRITMTSTATGAGTIFGTVIQSGR